MFKKVLLSVLLALVCNLSAYAELPAAASGFASVKPNEIREFWVWDLAQMPPGFRKVSATLRATGSRSLIYVEDKFWQKEITESNISNFNRALEVEASKQAFLPGLGIVALEEKIFAPLPTVITKDPRLVVLFADLGKYKDYEFDGFFNVFDQLTEQEAWTQYQQHSNQTNIIYMNGLRQDETYTLGVISHELQHLLAHNNPNQKGDEGHRAWLSESIAEGAMLLSGYFTDQGHVNRYIARSSAYALVNESYVQYGPQILFAAYLIDRLGEVGGLDDLTYSSLSGKAAVEDIFEKKNGVHLPFDAIYSNFINYIWDASISGYTLPHSWALRNGLAVPQVKAVAKIESFPSTQEGDLYPYSFAVYNLAKPLPDNADVKIELIPSDVPGCGAKGTSAQLLWKPLPPSSIAVYAVGCDPKSQKDLVRFRLSIFQKATIF